MGIKMLTNILDMFFKNKTTNFTKDCQDQSKTKVISRGNIFRNEIGPANTVSGSFPTIVVGVFFYQKALEKICGGRREEGIELHVQAEVIPYDDNPEDAYAVRIEIEDEIVDYLSRKQARRWRSKMISEGFSGAVTCPAKIAWGREFDKAGSYGVCLDIDLILPDSKPERLSVNGVVVTTNQSDHIEFLVNELNRFELLNCKVGDEVHFWEAGDSKEIFIYRLGTAPGHGKIGICPNSVYKVLHAAAGWDASIASIYEGGCKVACRLVSKGEMAERLRPFKAEERKRRQDLRRDLAEPVDYSVIDSDIYKCFISNQTGMCDAIGTWEQFKTIEECIARLCQENNGKYYKAKAKTAKFAIIFAPNARVYSNVTRLKEAGYKVTTFENALEHFGLTDLWDCKKIAQHEYDLKKFVYEDTFRKPFPLNK
jgi:hypothetical protein